MAIQNSSRLSVILNGEESNFAEYTEIVELSAGNDNTVAGMVVTYEGEVTAGTPGTHNHVKPADKHNAENNEAMAIAGIILRPHPLPENYDINDTIDDGEKVLILKPTGGKAVVEAIYADASDDVLPGQMLSLSSTAGLLEKTTFTFSATPTVDELEDALGALSEKVGVADAVAEDVAGTDIRVPIRY